MAYDVVLLKFISCESGAKLIIPFRILMSLCLSLSVQNMIYAILLSKNIRSTSLL